MAESRRDVLRLHGIRIEGYKPRRPKVVGDTIDPARLDLTVSVPLATHEHALAILGRIFAAGAEIEGAFDFGHLPEQLTLAGVMSELRRRINDGDLDTPGMTVPAE